MHFLIPLLFLVQDAGSAGNASKKVETASLSGTVVDAISNTPLSKATLHLTRLSAAPDSVVPFTTTDAAGRFAFAGIDKGAYVLHAGRSGYLDGSFGEKRSGEGTTIRLESGQSVEGVTVKLTPGGSISGTIRDADGEPIEANVVVSLTSYDDHGKLRVTRGDWASTNERGEYRLPRMKPGKYLLSAETLQRSRYYREADFSAAAATREAMVATYYPGVREQSGAVSVEVRAGREVAGIDFRLIRVPATCVSGRVTGFATGSRAPVVNLTGSHGFYNGGGTDTSGRFRKCDLEPGKYDVVVYADKRGAKLTATIGPEDTDLGEIRLGPSQTTTVALSVAVEGPDGKVEPIPRGLFFRVTKDGNEYLSTYDDGRTDGQPGAFEVEPGVYGIRVDNLPPDVYVRSMRAGNIDVLANGLNVSEPARVPVEVVMSKNGAVLSGVARDKDENAVSGAIIVLVPTDRSRTDLFQHASTDQSGRYEFTAVPPGSYNVFAWDDIEKNRWFDPEVLRASEKNASRVDLEAKQKLSADVRLSPLTE